MPGYTPEQFARLPKWVQSEIKMLNMRVRERDERLAVWEGREDTRIVLRSGLEKACVPEDVVEFHLGTEKKPRNYVSALIRHYRGEERVLELSASGLLIVEPRAANLIQVSNKER